MTEYLHPVSRACEEKSAETIEGLSKSELVYVIAELYDVTPPQDEDGEVVHPDDFNGSLSKDAMLELALAHTDVTQDEEDEEDEE